MFIPPHKTVQEQITDYCNSAQCEAEELANYVADSEGICPGDSTGALCWFDQGGAATLSRGGSTQVNHCPGVRRRKLTRGTLTRGTHSGAMMTKGVFTLTASGSK
jgi:cysteine synthase